MSDDNLKFIECYKYLLLDGPFVSFLSSFCYCFVFSLFSMDPALLRERELFKKRALSTPAIEKRPASLDSGSHKKKKPKVDKESSSGFKLGAGKSSIK